MKRTITKYAIITLSTERIIRKNFTTWNDAYETMLRINWGQFENEGGLTVCAYTA